jgi:hypothetical protein
MAEAQLFTCVKLICGIMASRPEVINESQERLTEAFGAIDSESQEFDFDYTDYYIKQMGGPLKRKFCSFLQLMSPEKLSAGFLNGAAIVMGTVKDFAHRIPLQRGIYGHLELLFGKNSVKTLEWTYPDFRNPAYHQYFLSVRKIYLQQLRQGCQSSQ